MGLDATGRRRWFGAVALLAAGAMLVAGETVLKERMAPVAFLVYWLACFVFTGLAIIIAFRDARAVREQTRQEQRDLLESALKEIRDSSLNKPSKTDPKARGNPPSSK
jgi:hypothetical protein